MRVPRRGPACFALLVFASVLLGCTTANPGGPIPPSCNLERVRFFNLPVTTGAEDPSMASGHGGIALRPMSGHTGALLRGSTVLLSDDSSGSNDPRWGEIVRESPVVFRDIPAGEYWLAFSFIGYQPFVTVVTVPAARVDTVAVVLYQVGVCFSSSDHQRSGHQRLLSVQP